MGGHGTLLSVHGSIKRLLGGLLVMGNLLLLLGSLLVLELVTLVLESGGSGDLGKESLVELVASGLVESKVAGHLGTHGRDITGAGSLLSGDLLLHIGKVIGEPHAAIRGVCDDNPDLLDVGRGHRGWTTDVVNPLSGCEDGFLHVIGSVGGNIHHSATDGKSAHKGHGNTRASLSLRHFVRNEWKDPH